MYCRSEKQWRQITVSFTVFLTPLLSKNTLNPKSFNTFHLIEDGASSNSAFSPTQEDIFRWAVSPWVCRLCQLTTKLEVCNVPPCWKIHVRFEECEALRKKDGTFLSLGLINSYNGAWICIRSHSIQLFLNVDQESYGNIIISQYVVQISIFVSWQEISQFTSAPVYRCSPRQSRGWERRNAVPCYLPLPLTLLIFFLLSDFAPHYTIWIPEVKCNAYFQRHTSRKKVQYLKKRLRSTGSASLLQAAMSRA